MGNGAKEGDFGDKICAKQRIVRSLKKPPERKKERRYNSHGPINRKLH